MKILAIILLFLNCILFAIADTDEKLIFLMTHYRHGARAPNKLDDNFLDTLKEKWTNPGELTGIGERMHYLLGFRNRNRYIVEKKFLSEKYDPHEILIYSSFYNRTLVSAASQLQGFYPQNEGLGETLTEEKKKNSYPPVDMNISGVDEELEKLGDCSLPNNMVLTSIRMINVNERRIRLFALEDCKDEVDEIKKKNMETLPNLISFVEEFNNKYGAKINEFEGQSGKKYDIDYIDKFCDSFIADYTEKRPLTEFKKTGIDFEELEEYCHEYSRMNFMYHYSGDKEKLIPHLEASRLMEEFIYYMQLRINADMNGENIDEKYKDFSKPKMLMISAHETTLSLHEMFLIDALGLNETFYIFPKFAGQMALEVTRKNDGPKKSYNDYFINYYLNDKLLLKMPVQEFIEKVEPHIWSDQKIKDFCGIIDQIVVFRNSTVYETKKDNAKTAYKVLMSVFICLSAILLALVVILGLKLSNRPSIK